MLHLVNIQYFNLIHCEYMFYRFSNCTNLYQKYHLPQWHIVTIELITRSLGSLSFKYSLNTFANSFMEESHPTLELKNHLNHYLSVLQMLHCWFHLLLKFNLQHWLLNLSKLNPRIRQLLHVSPNLCIHSPPLPTALLSFFKDFAPNT